MCNNLQRDTDTGKKNNECLLKEVFSRLRIRFFKDLHATSNQKQFYDLVSETLVR